MTARISLILGKTRGHRLRLQMLLHEFCNTLNYTGPSSNPITPLLKLRGSRLETQQRGTKDY